MPRSSGAVWNLVLRAGAFFFWGGACEDAYVQRRLAGVLVPVSCIWLGAASCRHLHMCVPTTRTHAHTLSHTHTHTQLLCCLLQTTNTHT